MRIMIVGSGKPSISGFDSLSRFNDLHYFMSGETLEENTSTKYNSSLAVLASPLICIW